MNLKTTLSFSIMFLLGSFLFAQKSISVKGNVISATNDEPIPGVTVYVKETKEETTTDIDGSYSIEVNSGETLEFSTIGFKTQEIVITDQTMLDVLLEEEGQDNTIEEVVMIGYGKEKKSHLTGAISKVTNENLDQIAVARVDDALVGQVSGVNIQSTEGEAGSAPTIRIRGTGSITGNSSPAIVVDGLLVDSDFLGSLDMNDVESFEVLKDAASAAIYGSRGGNGVILITTKQGKKGRTRFTYNHFRGFKEAIQSDSYYFSVAETAAAERAATGTISDKTRYKMLIGVDQDWQDIIFDGGSIESHSFAARGGGEKTRFSTSFGYVHDEGVLLTDDFKKYNLNFQLDTKLNEKFSFGVRLSPSYTNRRRFDGSTHDILRQPPWLPLRHDEHTIQFVNRFKYPDVQIGDYATQRQFDDYDLDTGQSVASGGTDISNTSNTNPGAKVLERDRKEYRFKLYGSVYAQYNITDDLSFKTSLLGDFQDTKRNRWQGVLSHRNGAANTSLAKSTSNRIHIVLDNILSYNKTFGKHEINAILGISTEKYDTSFESVTGTGYDSDLVKTISAATTISVAESYEYESRLFSYLGRFNYAYNDRYLMSLSFRRDGYSAFGPDNKYADFPAVSIGWIASKESFLEDSNIISNLKLRASYGVTGNPYFDTGDDIINNYPYLSLLESTTSVVNNAPTTAFNPINIANANLKWERSIEVNPGVDFGFFNNIITGSVDYYVRTSDQLLLNNPIASTTGFDEALVNLGKVENKGIEIELRTKNINNKNFKWSTTALMSRNENELVDFGDSNGLIQSVDSKRAAEWINLEGHPISSFYGWVVDRDIPLEYIKNPYHPVGGEAQDVYVKDLNGDGIIDDNDKTILGDPYPDFVWSVTNNFKYKNFDLSILFQGSHGAKVRNIGDQYLFNHSVSAQDFDPSTTPDQGFIKQKIFTDDIIQDASYIALRTVNLGYSFDRDLLNKLGITKARIYVAGQNLLYFTASDYTGFNPESIYNTSPTTYGYQRAGSPMARTISLGVNLEF